MPRSSFRIHFGRGFWLLAVLGALALVFSCYALFEERERLDALRGRIDASWGDLDEELRTKEARVTELLELAEGDRLRMQGRDFSTARDSLADAARNLGGARNREERVEANLNLDRALRRFMNSLAADGVEPGGPRALPGLRRAQEDILAVEHRVAQRRTAYNEAVQHFNTHLALFPANFAGAVFGIKRYPHYMPTNIRDIVQLPAAPVGSPETDGKAATRGR